MSVLRGWEHLYDDSGRGVDSIGLADLSRFRASYGQRRHRR